MKPSMGKRKERNRCHAGKKNRVPIAKEKAPQRAAEKRAEFKGSR